MSASLLWVCTKVSPWAYWEQSTLSMPGLHQRKCKNHCSHNNPDLCKDHASFFLISNRVFSAGHPLGVGMGLWASESKGLGLDTQVDFSSHLSLKNPFIL